MSTLCKGYQACNKAGMSAAGYANASKTMYWRMYAGHNCTNYAAYRMVQSGMPNVRPWSGGGNATYWGTSMSSITDQTPTVGSIAWWKAGSYPAGSSGHVAYVEQVVSPDEIVISQDSWGGDFSWARISRGRGWPDGFIHFNDAPLVNVEKPVVAGTPKVGGELVATPGAWAPGEVNTEYRWLVDGKRLRTADAAVLPLDESLLGRRIKVRVIATRIGYPTAKATSPATEAVLPGTLAVTEQPTVSGTPTVDEELILDPGAWSPAPDSVEQVWKVDGKRAGTGRTLPLTPDLVGRTVTAEVTATRAGYEPVKVDAAKLVVASGTQRVTREPRMRGGARPGQELRLSRIETARAADVQVRWLRDGIEVPGATGRRYELQ